MELKNPFGMKDGKLIHISEVSTRGQECGCFCPYCNSKLSAKLGYGIREPHFAHINVDCKYSIQSALHIFAKEVLEKNKTIMLPEVFIMNAINYLNIEDFEINGNHLSQMFYGEIYLNQKINVSKEKLLNFEHVEIERKLDGIIPDVILYKNGVPLIIEIAVTHEVDKEKLDKIRALQISVIEIYLGDEFDYYTFNRELIEKVIIESVNNKFWLYNRKAEAKKHDLIIQNQRELKEYLKQKEKQKEKQEAKERFDRERKEQLLIRIEKLKRDKEKLIKQFAIEAENNQKWIELSNKLKTNISNVPDFVNFDIYGELSFSCDRRIWQCAIFEQFVLNRKNKTIKLYNVYRWAEKHSNLPINPDLHYKKDCVSAEIGSLYDAILNYLCKLSAIGFLEDTNYYYDFYSEFKVIHDKFTQPTKD